MFMLALYIEFTEMQKEKQLFLIVLKRGLTETNALRKRFVKSLMNGPCCKLPSPCRGSENRTARPPSS